MAGQRPPLSSDFGGPAAALRCRRRALCSVCLLPAALIAPSASAQEVATEPPAGLDLYTPRPASAIATADAIALGRILFFDPLLSRDRSVSCATCHRPDLAFTDGLVVPLGVAGRAGHRNVPTLINRAWGRSFFRDGRALSLEEQVLEPIRSPAEMDMPLPEALARLERSPRHARAFRSIFGRAPVETDLARVLAAYVRSIRAGDSPFDRLTAGDRTALTPLQREGLELFQGRARCDRCHLGALFSDEEFHNTGVAWRDGAPADSGRFVVTRRAQDIGAFRTPTLREIARTAPYMHDGSIATLEEVLEFYDRGGNANPLLDPRMRPLHLSDAEKRALLAFLHALSGSIAEGTAGR